jgi:hypothetical protein
MELTGWQTVSVALGGGAVTGTAAILVALVSARQARKQLDRRLEHDRTERWRDLRMRASEDFSTGLEQAILGVRDVIAAVSDKGDVDAAAAEAKRRLDEAVARAPRIRLVFPAHGVTSTAGDALAELDLARAAAARPDPTFAWEKLEKVYKLRDKLNAAIRATLEPAG